jgi:hypothetical protein
MRFLGLSAVGVAAIAVAFGNCTSLAAEEESKPKRVCIDKRGINSISALDDQHAFVKRSASRFSLLTMDKKCHGLTLARTVVIEGSAARVCGDGGSLLSFEYPAVGTMRCRIERIESVPDKNAALELIESRAGPR